WYPKPAVYDAQGWHAMSYLDQGEFYSEFGNYKVNITLPKNYVVAATGQLMDESERAFLLSRNTPLVVEPTKPVKKDIFKKNAGTSDKQFPPSTTELKTIHYSAQNVIDFAWFADKRFFVQHDTISLPENPSIDAYTFILPEKKTLWQNSVKLVKQAVHFYAQQLGNYPYPTVSVVCAPPNTASGGMEYPTITLVNVFGAQEKNLDVTIAHEVGHNWLQAMLATNERDHPWMDEGMNTYFERKYTSNYYSATTANRKDFKGRPLSADPGEVLLTFATDTHSDQPIETTSEAFTRNNYVAVAYTKAGLWMEKLEQTVGTVKMQQLMQSYFAQWKMKHPQPQDFKQIADSICGPTVDSLFMLLDKTGPLPELQLNGTTKLSVLYPT
ncbi:MAG: M1 family peptidase, partial [Sphingobacteriaceae bacterium]